MARCAVRVAERSVRRRHRTHETLSSLSRFLPPCASLRAGMARRTVPTIAARLTSFYLLPRYFQQV